MCDTGPVSELAALTDHYASDDPFERILRRLADVGIDAADLQAADLAGVDEFHLGGKTATVAILESLPTGDTGRHLDIGCGIGGAARTIASTIGCEVVGLDLTPGFVATATRLSGLVGLSDRTVFRVANASTLDVPDRSFDSATLLHVGMNIEDKASLFTQVARVLRPGGSFHVYDIMRVGDGDIGFPVPWSPGAATSFVDTPAGYLSALRSAGLVPSTPTNRMPLVAQALRETKENPPKVSLADLMGENWPAMFANLSAALKAGVLAPVEIVSTVPAAS
jgi:ubiquinone/menaquinone biosynthesis C-methylase UbiE